MVGKLIREVYKYDEIVLDSETKATANEVTVQEGKVVNVPNGMVTVMVNENERSFNFSIYNYGANGEITYNLNNVPASVDGQKIVKEFVDFVEKDIA